MSGGNGRHMAKGSPKPVLPDDGVARLFSMRFCPYAQRAHLLLTLKNVPYHVVFINLGDKPEWLTDFSPLGKVPALHLVGEPKQPLLIESLVIAEYLDDKYPQNRLQSNDPLQRALDKILIERYASAVVQHYYKVVKSREESEVLEIIKGLEIFEKELRTRGHKYFAGDKPGFVDYMIWPWFERLAMLPYLKLNFNLDKNQFKHLLQWRDLMVTDEAVKKYFLDGETHAKYMETHDYNMLAK